MDMNFFVDEIAKAINVLGIEKGQCQNYIDITEWLKQGLINGEQAKELHKLNRNYK